MDSVNQSPVHRTMLPERSGPLVDLEHRIQNLVDGGQRDDVKLKMLQDIWSQIENHFTAASHEKVVEKLILSFLALFCNTSPQFISENNTQQLRKLMLEIILRLSNVEAIKVHGKDILKQMMRLIAVENEVNAVLAIKIVTDQGRTTGKMQYCGEVQAIMKTFETMIIELTAGGRTREMFITRDAKVPPPSSSDEQLITEYLKTCFYEHAVLLNGADGNPPVKYNMIPSAHQSIKVLVDIPYLVIFFYQHFKTAIQTEALEFMRLGLAFFNVKVPTDPKYNQALCDEYVTAQSRFLSFVNIMAKIPAFMDLITQNGEALVSGIMQMLERCPADLITVRREVLMALKFFTSAEMKSKFFPMLPRLISEHVVLGTGFTAIEHLRVFMYQMLADLLHHMRNSIGYDMIAHVAFVFCRTLHDPNNTSQVQIMSARLLNSLAESLSKMDSTDTTRDLLMEILEAHVAKLKIIAVYHMPILFQQYGTEIDYEYKNYERESDKPGTNIPKDTIRGAPKRRIRKLSIDSVEELEYCSTEPSSSTSADAACNRLPPPTKEDTKKTSPEAILTNMNALTAPPLAIVEARNLVKYILQTCKFVTGQLRVSRPPQDMYHCTKERDVFERLLRYGVMCMDVFVLPTARNQPQMHASLRTKDEKDALESLANVFTTIDHAVFREIFEKYMDFLIERIYNRNYPLQLIVNTFLVRNEVPFFASTMLSFLMSRMKLLEVSNDKTTLYVKLFKIIFSAIGSTNSGLHSDKMLTSYLPEILKQSTVLALTAREPLNYFLLLRSLFRSIGGGAQDVLYGKFLQLLPNLLQFLNKLTSCQHRIQMRELFVELCLTVPVRLSSLLPYLPLLMDPLVCAMNGSPNIVTQGLRTLELCVDNLQPDFLLEHMIPVRAALVQGLYRVVSKAPDTASMAAAFRILGKFGGANRRLLYQPQILDVVSQADRFQSYINMEFSRMGLDGQHSIQLPLTELMRVAADQMRYPADQILNPNPQMIPSASMKKWCMELSKAILLAGFGSSGSHFVPNRNLPRVLKKLLTEFDVNNRTTEVYTCTRENDRELFVNALLVMIYGIWNKDGFRNAYSKFFIKVLRQFSIIAVLEYVGGNNWIRQAEEDGVIVLCLDSSVLVDALIICLSETSTTFLFAGVMCLRHINESLCLALPHTDQMSKVPMCKYLMEKVFKLCHGPAWYARAGGIQAIVYMIESFPRKFVMDYVIDIVDSVVEVLLGLTEEISSGATDAAYECLKKMMLVYFIPEEGQEEENLTLATIFMSVFAKHYFSSNERIRELMADLVGVCMKYSRLAPTLDKFYFRFKEFFEPEMERILSTLPTMSLSDASGSLDGVQNYMLTCPDGFEFEKDADLYKRYLTHLLDIAQTDTTVISQRYAYKKCETCPSHFLPPHPIPVQIDLMRASALQCLVIAYDRLKKQMSSEDGIEGEEVMSEILALDSPSITVEQVYESKETWRRLMTVLLRAAVDKENPDIAEKIQPVLLKVSPIPTNIIATFGAAYIRSISRASENNEEISFHDIRKFSVLVDLNPGILVRKMAINLANQMVRFKMEEKTSKILFKVFLSGTTESEIVEYEAEKKKAIRELDRIGFTVKMLAGCQMSTLTHEMVIDIARFAAHFDYTYAQDVLVNWIDDVSTLMNKCPVEVWKFFLDRESILDPGRRSFIRRIIVYPSSGPLRQTFMDNPEYLDRLIDMDGTVFRDDDDRVISDREMFALSLVDRISRNCHDWLISPLSPIAKLKKLFNSTGFVERYGVRTITEVNAQEIQVLSMTEHKYKVPKLIINIFLRYLRVNIFDYDMFFDVVSVFMGKFVTDFCFVREYLEVEVIPKMPLKWRREIFLKVMEMLEENPVIGQGLQYVKVVQYLIIPSLQWAFERYDTDEIVGSTPIDDSEISIEVDSSANMDNLVGRLTAVIARKLSLSDGMVIVLYQLCTLFVQHASEHIHNNNCKKQGGRLRVFMLFAWPCLTEPNRQDPTMRYTGFYFLANIIERFTINRKIVLQVFHQLVTTYQQDTRDQVRRAIDILTPALRVRMEDGHQQILTSVKKILIEECHNLSHIQHIFHMIIRNYRVYYHVRNELLSHLLNAVQRALVMPNSVMENWQTRRYAIEICEMVVKWELFKNLKTDHAISDEEALEIDNRLDKLRSAASTERFDFEDGPNKRDLPESQRVVGKEPVDIIVNMLLRFCMTFHQNSNSSTGSQSQSQDLIKKSQLLLRAALRSSVWGEFVSIRTSMIEKYLSISNDANIRNDTMSPVFVSVIANAQQTLDMVCAIIPVIPKQTLMNMMRPLQRPLIQCLNSGPQLPEQNFKMTRLVTQIITRLLEKTTVTMHGLDELDMLNNHIIKFLNDNFSALVNFRTPGAPVLGVLGAFSLLRSICAHEPAYLDNVLSSFVKVVERAAKEHLSYTSNGSEGSIVKNVAELLVVCMELIRVRADQICVEIKRIMVSSVIAEIILKSHNDKVIQACVKVLGSFITPHDMDFTVNVVLINLVRIQTMIVSKFKSSKDLIADFLVVVIKVFENSEYRNSDPGSRLWEGFFWGLKSADPQTRENFSIIWEMTWPQLATVDMVHRMKYIIRDQDWSKFKHAFWLKFALWGMLRTIAKRPCDSTNKRKKVMFLNCATPWRTIEYAAKLRHDPTIMEQEMKQEEPEPMDTDEKPSQDDQNEKVPESLDALLEGQQELLDEASNYDFADALDVISQITFGLSDSDNKVTSNIWVILFRSFWSSLSPSEIEDFNTLIIPFLSSGVHNNYQTGVQDSVLAVWLRALADLTEIPARLIEFISIKHECWHTGIKILENNVICRPIAKQLKNIYLQELTVDPSLVSDMQTLESLGALYQDILEFDQFAGIWERRAVFPETVRAMSAIQLGDMESAATLLEQAMSKTHDALAPAVGTSNSSSMEKHVSPFIDKEYDHWMDMYISSCSELLQWQTVAEVCNSKDMQHVQGLITAASHIPDWAVVEECKNQIAGCIPPNFHLDYTIYNLMSTVMRLNENSHPNHSKEKCKIALQECIEAHISRWRALPSVASYAHVKLLQSMNLIQDIEESIEVRIALCDQPNKIDQALMMDMKGLMKVYRSRSPASADNMSFISSWYDWRNQIYGMMLQRFEQWDKLGLNLSTNGNQSIVPIHSMAQAQLTAAKHAQHLGFHNLTKDLLNKLAGLTAIPMVDARNKVCTYGKTLREMAKNTPEEKLKQELLHEALEVLEDVRIDDFQKDQIAMLLYNRANIHSVLGQTQNADNTFSTAAQLVELHNGNSVVACKLMKNWGHHLYNQFFSSKVCKETADNYGRQALACYFVAARVDNDVKARKAIARILWLAKHLAACGSHDALNRGIKNQIHALNLFNWLYWLPQLVTEIRHKPSSNFVLIMCRMAAAHPLQVFYHIREAVSNEYIDTIFEKDYSEEEMSAEEFDEDLFPKDEPFSRILKICLKYRPTDVRVFHRVLKELDEMDETWVERQLRYALRLKEQMFNDISDQMDANFNHIQFSEFVKNIAAAWKKQLEEDYEYFQQNFNTDYLVLRNRKKINVTQGFMGVKKSQIMFEKQLSHVFTDPPEMKDEFSFVTEFTQMIVPRLDLDNVEENGPTILVRTVVDWIRILRRRLEKLPKRVPLECSSLYLSRFSHRTGCIEMPNDLLNVLKNKNPQNSTNLTGQYISMISRFEPTFEIITRGEHVMRKLYIRGQLGKSAAFYLKKSIDDEPPNRVPQLLKHLDHLLQFDHESARRHLHVPNIVQLRVGPKTILYEIASVQPYAMPTDCTRNYPSSQIEIIHPYDVLAASLNGNVLPADMVTHFFDRFAQSAPSIGKPNGDGGMLTQPRLLEPHNVKHIIFEDFARDMVSYRFLFEYFQSRYPDPVMYYSMRKQFLHSLAVLSTIEYHCNLTPLGPDQMMMFANTGVLCNPWYRFEISKGQSLEEIEHFGHEVPFRLTPNIAFIVGVAQDGDFMWSMAAASKCLMKKEPEVVMKTLLWDEYANNVDSENMVYVCHASNSYVAGITNKLKNTNDPDAKVKKDDIASLISRAKDSDNQSRMPPTYFAWY